MELRHQSIQSLLIFPSIDTNHDEQRTQLNLAKDNQEQVVHEWQKSRAKEQLIRDEFQGDHRLQSKAREDNEESQMSFERYQTLDLQRIPNCGEDHQIDKLVCVTLT